jgi:predicted nucleic acid-binding protein
VVEELIWLKVSWPLEAGLRVIALDPAFEGEADEWHRSGLIERGEAHAIALARQIQADVFLTDDAAARLFAASLGLHARGSLGVVLRLAGQRTIADVQHWGCSRRGGIERRLATRLKVRTA